MQGDREKEVAKKEEKMRWRKFKKKPVIVEATQWFSLKDLPSIVHPCKREGICKNCGRELKYHGWIETLEGEHIVCPGDWIIRGVTGEYYPVKPEIFEQTYIPLSAIGGQEMEGLLKGKIVVYKDGTYKVVKASWEYENDPDYLVTIPLGNVFVDLVEC